LLLFIILFSILSLFKGIVVYIYVLYRIRGFLLGASISFILIIGISNFFILNSINVNLISENSNSIFCICLLSVILDLIYYLVVL